jgi:hypothetical protein
MYPGCLAEADSDISIKKKGGGWLGKKYNFKTICFKKN